MRTTESTSLRGDVLRYAKKQYHTEPEYLWRSVPNYCVLRHGDSRKWYAIIMDVSKNKLGLSGDEIVDILDVKTDPILSGSLRDGKGIFPGYHMQKGGWISILLDGSVDKQQILWLLDMSFAITSGHKNARRIGVRNTNWLVPANPKYYDIETAITESRDGMFLWKQSNHIAVGDTVYLYVAAPVSSIRYRCQAVEVDIPYFFADKNVHMSHVMKLRLLQRYDEKQFGLPVLKAHGIASVRGPRSMPNSLLREIGMCGDE